MKRGPYKKSNLRRRDTLSVTQAFEKHLVRKGADECWELDVERNSRGYGRLRIRGADRRRKWVLAHRVSWMIHHGEIPDGMVVCHRCDNPPCVNPAHLFLGTFSDNSRDCVAKGRHVSNPARGSANASSKLTESEVREIRRVYQAGGWSLKRLGERYGVSPSAVWLIMKGKNWSCVA